MRRFYEAALKMWCETRFTTPNRIRTACLRKRSTIFLNLSIALRRPVSIKQEERVWVCRLRKESQPPMAAAFTLTIAMAVAWTSRFTSLFMTETESKLQNEPTEVGGRRGTRIPDPYLQSFPEQRIKEPANI